MIINTKTYLQKINTEQRDNFLNKKPTKIMSLLAKQKTKKKAMVQKECIKKLK
jgi:hypothetical protein